MIAGEVYLVRHGEYNYSSGDLTDVGSRQSLDAASKLYDFGVTLSEATPTLLSSDYPRAVQTAEIIGRELGGLDVVRSAMVRIGGNEPEGIENLDDWLSKALERAGIEQTGDLVVVTHQPMTDIAVYGRVQGRGESPTPNGEVLRYVRDSWNNMDFATYFQEELERRISALRG